MNKRNWKKDFCILWTGQAMSVLTSSILQMVLIWHLAVITQSALVLSVASLAGFLPSAVLGIVAGTFVDRVNRKVILIGADLFIAAVSIILAVASWFGNIPVWLILTVLAIRSIGTAFHTPAISAVTPLLVPEENLTKCAGYTQSLQTVGNMAGVAIAGILYPIWSISAMVALDVIGAIIASLSVIAIKVPNLDSTEKIKNSNNFGEDVKTGYSVLKKETGILALVWVAAVFTILYFPINALFPLISLDYFGGTTFQASIAEIAFSVGMLAGGIILGFWGGIKNRGIGIPLSILLMGVSIALSGMLPPNGFWVFVFLCVVMGISAPFYNGPITSLMQEKISPEYLGRAFGFYGSVASCAMPIGLLISGAFADVVGTTKWFLITGFLIIILALSCFALSPIRRIDKESKKQNG